MRKRPMDSRICPKAGGKVVDTCEGCEYYREKQNHFVCENPCRWYISHPEPKAAVFPKSMEIYKLEKEIETMKRRAAYHYDKSRPKFAREAEAEITKLKYRLARLEEEKSKWQKENTRKQAEDCSG